MHALITGGAGFIGSHLAERLRIVGHQVTVIDNLATGSLDDVRHLIEAPGIGMVTDSILSVGLMEYLVRQYDVVFHLAATLGLQRTINQPLISIQSNIRATEIVPEHANCFEKPILVASTSQDYQYHVPDMDGAIRNATSDG